MFAATQDAPAQPSMPSPCGTRMPTLPLPRLPAAELAWRVLEQIDYGLLLVNPEGVLQHANQLACQELGRGQCLRLDERQVLGPDSVQTEALMRGVQSAAQGRRQMLTLSHTGQTLPVACVPLLRDGGARGLAPVLLLLARQSTTQNLAVTFFARTHGLSPAEEAVLKALCSGQDVRAIATAHGVTEYTVRTQVRSLRDKTGASNMRTLVQQVAALPPMVPVWLGAELTWK